MDTVIIDGHSLTLGKLALVARMGARASRARPNWGGRR